MTQSELLNIVRNSIVGDWDYIKESPTFLGVVYDTEKSDYHNNRAVYKLDISISLVWGLVCVEEFQEEWANNHPNPDASSYYLDIFYNGMLAYRTVYAAVDGHRSKMPLPNREDNGKGIVTWWITRDEDQLFRLFNEIQNSTNYDDYIRRCGIIVR